MPKRAFERRVYLSDPTGGDAVTGYTGSNEYRVRIAADIAAIGALGFGADDPTAPSLPQGLRMRYIVARNADGTRARKLPCGNIAAAAFTTPGTALSMDQWNETGNLDLVITGKVGETRTW